MILESAAVGPFVKNGYVVCCENTRKAVFIDPGDEVEQLLDFIRAEKLDVTHILLTHAHIEQSGGTRAFPKAAIYCTTTISSLSERGPHRHDVRPHGGGTTAG
jgi:glyoxylase-like metal-dependent hydrolase (beta-lactamase superfamily II)